MRKLLISYPFWLFSSIIISIIIELTANLMFIINLNLLIYLIFKSISISALLLSILLISKVHLRERRLRFVNKNNFIFLFFIYITILIGITILAKQYGLTFCFSIIGFGLLSYFIISIRILLKRKRLISFIFMIIIFLNAIIFGFFSRGILEPNLNSQIWNMHHIDNPGYILPNGLDAADVNNDGFNDYLTNYEWDGKLRIAFYPGISKVKNKWPAITIGSIENAENAVFGDFDNDGNIDVVVAHGEELSLKPGVLFIWGPDSFKVYDESAWNQSGDIPGTSSLGHINYIRHYDINGDNSTDIVIGGRGKPKSGGLRWIESPNNVSEYQNLSKWKIHDIDSDLESGHGFVFEDIDLDGNKDIAVCNSDWDTDDLEEKLVWYENPGTGIIEQKAEWTQHLIYKGSEFYSKEQITFLDFTNDSYPDLIMQTISHIYIFENSKNFTQWELIKFSKPPITCWRARTINLGDINNDNKTDLIGMLIHWEGVLPKEKAAVFWMEYHGSDLKSFSWITSIIKWGDDFIGIGTYNGEKWDQCILEDVDRDGDIDIVANCEEFNSLGFVYISVVWFENPLI